MLDRFKIGHDMPTNTPPSIEGKCINVTFIKETPPPPPLILAFTASILVCWYILIHFTSAINIWLAA